MEKWSTKLVGIIDNPYNQVDDEENLTKYWKSPSTSVITQIWIDELAEDTPDYRYNEDYWLERLKEYIDSTYEKHYAEGEIQASEFIQSSGHGLGFFMGNIIKYADRYGKKEGFNELDLFKVLHYAIMALNHQEELEDASPETNQEAGTRETHRCKHCTCDSSPRG
jgi:hypothetical protein